MRKHSQVIEIIRLVTLLMGGLGTVSAYAQAPTFSPPGLPPIPGLPSTGSAATSPIPQPPGMGIVSPPKLDTSRVDPPPNPGLSDLTKVPGTPVASQDPAAAAQTGDDALADLPPPPTPEGGDVVAGSNPKPTTTAPAAEPPAETAAGTSMPAPPSLPGGVSLPPPPITANNVAIPAIPLPEIDTGSDTNIAMQEKPATKSWQTTLKPVSTAYDTKFNYRRVALPEVIYRTAYNRDNSHLPVRVTRDDYVYMLFERAAVNDINGTRALLNAGTDINATNSRGETPLQVARRFGAMDTASLLMARGAR